MLIHQQVKKTIFSISLKLVQVWLEQDECRVQNNFEARRMGKSVISIFFSKVIPYVSWHVRREIKDYTKDLRQIR